MNVYQFKITLKETAPPVWRRIQVPESYSFWDLHVAIQDAMGWMDCHLHEFTVKRASTGSEMFIGLPDPDYPTEKPTLAGRIEKISAWLQEGASCDYIYDMGDGWEHEVTLEAIVPAEPGAQYPVCLGGKRACPPEDCGGIPGYEDICLGESEFQEEYAGYDPAAFDPATVNFDDPAARFELAFD